MINAYFRMLPEIFEYLLSFIGPKLQRGTGGAPMISPQEQCWALWRLAIPDSFR